ncbi:MAG TPA: hypothetical protein VEY88_08980 [Archangium sp.]|nr:hypothetical protein [Archangium sp.]
MNPPVHNDYARQRAMPVGAKEVSQMCKHPSDEELEELREEVRRYLRDLYNKKFVEPRRLAVEQMLRNQRMFRNRRK